MCVPEPARGRRRGTTSIAPRLPVPTIEVVRWRCWRRWRCTTFQESAEGGLPTEARRTRASEGGSGDFPAVAAQRVHQLHRSFDELGRLVDFFHSLASIRPRGDDTIAAP